MELHRGPTAQVTANWSQPGPGDRPRFELWGGNVQTETEPGAFNIEPFIAQYYADSNELIVYFTNV